MTGVKFDYKKLLTPRNIVIGVFALITFVLMLSLILWAANAPSQELVILDAEVTLSKDVRREYIQGESVSGEGVSLSYDGTAFTEFEVNCDTATAGYKRVEVTHEEGNTLYRGYYAVEVLGIRHCVVKRDPMIIIENGEYACYGLEIWADLNKAPNEIPTTGTYDTVVKLPESMCETEVTPLASGVYQVKITLGERELSRTVASFGFDTNAALLLANANEEGKETLALYIIQPETNIGDGERGALGFYVFTASDGVQTLLSFACYVDSGWTSHFVSASYGQGVVDSYDNGDGGFNVTYQGVTFHASGADYHRVVLAGAI